MKTHFDYIGGIHLVAETEFEKAWLKLYHERPDNAFEVNISETGFCIRRVQKDWSAFAQHTTAAVVPCRGDWHLRQHGPHSSCAVCGESEM